MINMLLLVILGCAVIGLLSLVGGISVSMWIAYYYPKPIIFLVLGTLIYILIYLAGSKINYADIYWDTSC